MASEAGEDKAFRLAGDRLGDYVILGELGRGSMGVVYEAFQERLKRKVALKILPANITLDGKQVRRFHREAESVARLRHENIIQIYEVGESGNTYFFAMEFVDGRTLADERCTDRESVRRVAALVRDAASGLAHAHERGVIHRDIKPSNLLVDRSGRVIVTDFGLARLTESTSLTSTDAIVGTPKYMSPEQVLPGTAPLDGRADIYSLGATLYEIVAGRPPLDAPSVQAFLKAILEERPVTPRRHNRAVDHDLATIILRCLEKSPESRYPDAAELAADLDRYLRGERIRARPRGTFAIGLEVVRRHRVIAALAAVAAIALGTSLWLGGRVARESGRASVLASVNEIRGAGDLDLALQRAQELAARYPGEPAVAVLLRDLHERHALRELEGLEPDFDVIRVDLERAGLAGSFWHLMMLVELGRLDEALAVARTLPEGDPDRLLASGRIALARGDTSAALAAVEALDGDLHPGFHLLRGQAYAGQAMRLEARGGGQDEVRGLRQRAMEELGLARRLGQALHQRWLRARIDLELFDVRVRMGESVRITDAVGDLGAVAGEAMRRLTTVWTGLTKSEADIAQEFVRRVLALAGEGVGPPALLERRARLRMQDADPRERALANLVLGVAHLSDGLPDLAQEALSNADSASVDPALTAYTLWGLSLAFRAKNNLPQAVGFALEAFDWARASGSAFEDIEPLARHVLLLAEEAYRRDEAAEGRRAAEFLRGQLDDVEPPALWVNEVLGRLAAASAPPR